MAYKYLSVLFYVLTFISCNTSVKTEKPVTENTVTEIISNQLINRYRSIPEIRVLSDEEITAYKIDEFVNKHERKNTFLLDSVKLYPNIRSYIFIEHDSEKMWIVNYDQHLNYIDNRWIYKIENGDTVSSVIKITEKMIYTKDTRITYYDEYYFPTKVHSNGVFEDMPDKPYVEDMLAHYKDSAHIYTNKEIAFSGCVGLAEKFYPNVEWTAIDFGRRKIEQIKTTRNYIDYLESPITLYKRMSEKQIYDDFYPNIAFRGKHNIELISLDTIHDEEFKKHLASDIEITLKDEERIYPKDEDLTEPITSDINYAVRYSPDGDIENTYVIVQLKTERLYNYNSTSIPYECLVVITPAEEIKLLAPYCVYDFFIFKIDGKPHLYTMYNSCGEGAVGVDLLFKINNTELEKVIEYHIACD